MDEYKEYSWPFRSMNSTFSDSATFYLVKSLKMTNITALSCKLYSFFLSLSTPIHSEEIYSSCLSFATNSAILIYLIPTLVSWRDIN